MISKPIEIPSEEFSAKAKLKDYSQLFKVKLTLTVVFSAAMGYLLAVQGSIIWLDFILLVIGGFLVVGAANGINQIIEKKYDKMMDRTANRPVATERMSINEAAISCLIAGLGGVVILWLCLNLMSGLLAIFSLISYAFIYTPMKRISPIAVFIGAFPGAIAPLLGWVAVTGKIDSVGLALFAIQFIWQFPHFWAIAWLLHDDYKKAGYHLLPSYDGPGKKSALQIVFYTIVLIPMGLLPYQLGVSGIISAIIAILAAIYVLYKTIILYKTCSIADAKKVMFAALLYLPLVQLAFVLDKI